MTLNIILIMVALLATIVILVYVFAHTVAQLKTTLAQKEEQITTLTQELETAKLKNKWLEDTLKKKQEVINETNAHISDIASSDTESSVSNLQKPRKTRKSRSASTSS